MKLEGSSLCLRTMPWRRGGLAPLILNVDTSRKGEISFTPEEKKPSESGWTSRDILDVVVRQKRRNQDSKPIVH
jgi:hypothetical protein